MLFTYPTEATEDNWLSDCLTTQILSVLEELDADLVPTEFPLNVDDNYQEIISGYPAIITRFLKLTEGLEELDAEEREIIRNAAVTQNQFPEIFDGVSNCIDCSTTLPKIHELARDLFEFSFRDLSIVKSPGSEISIRDHHYIINSEHLPKRCCPFCGLERFEPYHPDIPRPDLDHYLVVSKYPFAGINLKNLAPMGDRCNSSYKLALDVLHDDGNRVPCYDPYGDLTTTISLDGSQIFGDPEGNPLWQVNLGPDAPETYNWNRVFRIRTRIEHGVLRADFQSWLGEIGGFLQGLDFDVNILEHVTSGLQRYKKTCQTDSLPGIGLLKEAAVSLILESLESEEHGERTHAFLRDAFAGI